ncbi:Putative porin [Lishizhenia tianjinensis]|uniref:Putative porin n=1 Tax=Lishizhenia tianjinensis TaxID=477690 RepID=A0A1I6YW24_9FLAO|nr:putative porin [Lishizhenia tianjinensis]SFT54564.1 Putative porin [Lishizhenia tianjinensis]
MKRILLVLMLVLTGFCAQAQNKLLAPKIDSITLDYRSSGYALDSVDVVYGANENLRPSGFNLPEFGLNELLHQRDALGANLAGFNYLQRQASTPILISPLPYIGFQYSFGGSLTQNLDVQYSQALSPKTLLNIHYNKKSSDGFLRSSKYAVNDVNAVLIHRNKHYSTKLDAKYSAYTWSENGGMSEDSLLQDYIISFTPVNKSSAESTVKKADISWENYLNLSGDNMIKTGFYQVTRYEVINRLFTDNAPTQLTDTFYIDSNRTRDQYQTASIKNGAGYFFSSKYFEINASVNHRYWSNQNLNRYFDTTEIFLASELYAGFEKFNLHNTFYFNLVGATGEIKNYTRLQMALPLFDLNAKLDINNLYPTPYQRQHYANNFQWKLTSLSPQQIITLGGDLKLKGKLNTGVGVDATTVNNGLYFINNTWRQDTLNTVSAVRINAFVDYNLGKLHLSHNLAFNLNSANFNFQPKVISSNRIAYKTPIFKAAKLKMNLGLDLQYLSEYNSMLYLPEMSLYSPLTGAQSTGNYVLVHAFAAIDLDPFRLFFRAENVSSLWNDARIRVDEEYPIMPLFVRLGVSWDFFN